MFNELRWEAIVCFVDIGGIVNRHCLKLSFHNHVHIKGPGEDRNGQYIFTCKQPATTTPNKLLQVVFYVKGVWSSPKIAHSCCSVINSPNTIRKHHFWEDWIPNPRNYVLFLYPLVKYGYKKLKLDYGESTFILWHQCSWFLQNALIHGFLNSWFLQNALIPGFLNSWFLQNALIHGFFNSWFQTLQATINWNFFFFFFEIHKK